MKINSLCNLLTLFGCCSPAPATTKNTDFTLANIHSEKLATGTEVINGTNGLKIYKLIPQKANQNWSLSIADLSNSIPTHYHSTQTQVIKILEGKLKVTYNDKEISLSQGQCLVIPPDVIHSLNPIGGLCRIAEIDLNGKDFPVDTYFVSSQKILEKKDSKNNSDQIYADQTINFMIESLRHVPTIEPAYYVNHFNKGTFSASQIVPPEAVEGKKWSLALIDLTDAPKHFHLKGTETFIVLNGILDIEIDGQKFTLLPGNLVNIPPTKNHHLKSGSDEPVRVLCINNPGFDPEDFYLC